MIAEEKVLAEIMTSDVISVALETPLEEVVKLMRRHKISSIIATKGGCPEGIFT